jgi:hypothetical protein
MGDESPTIDEINRQKGCLKKCADTFSKVEQAWMKMYDDKIISLERVLEEFRKARDDHQKCIDKCVPQRRHFTDEQKQHFETAGLEFAGIGAISAIAGVGAATLFDAPVAGGAMISFGAAFVAISYVAAWVSSKPGAGQISYCNA